MTISSSTRKAGPFTGNGTATTFPFTFKVFQASDLLVVRLNTSTFVESTLVLNTDYTVALNQNQNTNPGGSIVLGSVLATGFTLTATSDIQNLQPTDLTNQGGFYPTVINDALDRATIQIQQIQEEVDRSLKYPISDPVTGAVLPPVGARASKVLAFDPTTGEPIAGPSIGDVATVVGNLADIHTVASDVANINIVAADKTNIDAVAANKANIDAVAGNATNINAVNANKAHIDAVATDLTNINAVAGDLTNIDAVAGDLTNINAVKADLANIDVVATNVVDVNNFADVYQGAKATDPTLRNNGSALHAGDMYFNTAVNEIRIYSGTVWVAGTAGTMAVQRFDGTGSATVFTLATAPAGENNTQVYINGVYQQKDSYAVSGVTLTFDSAPPAGTGNIEVVTISTLALGATDSSLVTFLPPGTGAVQRSSQSKMRDFVSVKDFGAVGDGVVDDTLAINRAVKYVGRVLGGGTVYYPPGTYKVTRAIRLDDYDIETFTYSGNVRRNVSHIGAGRDSTTIKASGFWTSIFTSFPEPFLASNAAQPALKDPSAPGADENVFLADGIVIDGFTLDCDYNTNVDGGATYGTLYASWGGTWPNGATGASTWAADNYQYPIYAYNVRGLLVQNCRIKNSWFNGVEIYRCHEVQILNNIIQNCGDKACYLGYYSGVEFDNGSYKCQLIGNIIKNTGTGLMSNGDTLSYVWRAVQEVQVSNNIFDTCYNSAIYAFDWVADWQITNNEFINIGVSGIQFATNATPVAGRQPQYCKISGNLIRSYNTRNQVSALAIRAMGSGITVTENSIFLESTSVTANTWGIVASDPSTSVPTNSSKGILVANNFLCGRFPASDQSSGGGILAGATYCQVIGNTIISTASVAYTAIMIAADDVKVSANDVRGSWIYGSGKKAIFRNSGLRPYLKDAKFEPYFDIRTGAGRSLLNGWNVVDFTNFTPTTYDNRGNFNTGTNAFVADIPGLYRFTAQVRFSGTGSVGTPTAIGGLFEVNGGTGYGGGFSWAPGSGEAVFSALIQLNAGDGVTLKSYGATTHTVESGTNMYVEFVQQRT